MRHQQRIYIQNGHCVRNRDDFNVSMSSDLCNFQAPLFYLSGTTKIINDTQSCDLDNIDYDSILGTEHLSGGSFNSAIWTTSIIEDDVTVLEDDFYTSLLQSGDVPTETMFINSVRNSFNFLGYEFIESGTTFNIKKPFGVEKLDISICITYDIINGAYLTGATCGCPVGYSANTGGDACVSIISTGSTLASGGTVTAIAGDTNNAYGDFGAYFFPDISTVLTPLVRLDPEANLREVTVTGATVTATTIVTNGFWGDLSGGNGRLYNCGLKKGTLPLTEWVGFSKCIDIPQTQTYYIGVGADNGCRLRLNGNLILNLDDMGSDKNFKIWHMLPVTLNSGINIIEMEGRNDNNGSATAFGAEIYSADLATLTGATTTGDTGIIFSTKDMVGEDFDLGETNSGYSCPTGYALNTCVTGTPTCILIDYITPAPCLWSGSTDIECVYTACTEIYDIIQSGDTGVYIIDEETTIPITFNFTGDTSSVNDSTIFKYEVYKYNHESSIFIIPPVYQSEELLYSSFSGITEDIVISNIPVNVLRMDGDYLVKGFFNTDFCTSCISNDLNIKLDTSNYRNGAEFGLYNAGMDYYFVAINKADTPIFNTSPESASNVGQLYSTSIFPTFEGQIAFPFNQVFVGDPIVSLNGLVLSKDNDYSFNDGSSGLTLTFVSPTVLSDVITIVFITGANDLAGLTQDNILVTNPIVSGATDMEGSSNPYYNITTGYYEIFLNANPVSPNDILVTLNGILLANNIDYYQSITNPRRIILNGVIIPTDILTIYYNAFTNVVGNIFSNSPTISWYIETPPANNNGDFLVELTNEIDTTFSSLVSTATTQYIAGETTYSTPIIISGATIGDSFIYRVKNEKRYTTLIGDEIISDTYSEVIKITLQSNAINSY